MIQQSIAQFTRNAQKASSIVDDEKLPDRQRGMWSFLTWSFFLAQAVAAHEAFANGHGPGEGGIDGEGSNAGSGDDAAQKALASTSMLGVSGFDGDAAAAAQFAAALAAGLVTPQMWGAFQNDPAAFQAFVDALTGHAQGAAGISLDGDQAMAAAAGVGDGDAGAGDGGTGEGPLPGIDLPGINLPGIDLPGGITLPIDIAIDLGLELGSDLGLGLHIGGLDDISLNLNVAPILGLNLGLDHNGLDLSLLGIDLSTSGGGGVLGSLLGGEHGVLSGLPLGAALDGLSGVTGIANDVLGGPIGHIASTATSLLGDVSHVATNTITGLTPVTSPVTSLVGEVLDYGAQSGLLASGGTILQTLGSSLPLHDLFTNGQHTEYGLQVQASQSTEPAHSDQLVASLSANVETLDVGSIADDALKSLLHGISSDWNHG